MSLYDDCYSAYKGELKNPKDFKDEIYYTYIVYNCYSSKSEVRNGITFKDKDELDRYLASARILYEDKSSNFCILNQYNDHNKTYYYTIVDYNAYKQAKKKARQEANAGGGYFGAGWPRIVNFIICLIWPLGYVFGVFTPWFTEKYFCYKFGISFARLCLGIFPLTALGIWIFDLIGIATDNELKGCSSSLASTGGYGSDNIWINNKTYNIIYRKK